MPLFNGNTNTDITTQDEESTEEIVTVEEEPNLPDVALIVEDGSGVSDSNVYSDLDYAVEYCVMKGYDTFISLSEDEQKVALIRGTDFVDNFFHWKGVSLKGQYQSMSFPRERIYDDRGYEIKGIPDKLKKACIEAAYLNASSGSDTLYNTTDVNGEVKRQRVDTLEVEYFQSQKTTSSQVDYTSIYDVLNKLLKGLYKEKSDASKVCTRAIHLG